MNALQAVIVSVAGEELRHQWVAIGGDHPLYSKLSRNHAWKAETAAEFKGRDWRVASVQKLLNVFGKAHR